MTQFGSGKCLICGSPGTSKLTCPLNPDAKNPNPSKHPLAKSKMSSAKPKVTTVLPKDSKLLQLKGPGSMPKPSVKSSMLTKRIKPVLPKSTFMESMNILNNRNMERNPVEHSRRMLALDTIDSLMNLPQDVGDKIFKYSTYNENYTMNRDREQPPPKYVRKHIVPVNYINTDEDTTIMDETGQYVYFVTVEPPERVISEPENNVAWYNSYSKALDSMQGHNNNYYHWHTPDERYPSGLYVYFFDSEEYYLVGEENISNGKSSINIYADILKYISGNNFKGDVIYAFDDDDLTGLKGEIPEGVDIDDAYEIHLNYGL
jgi:hypothetical protein